MREILPAVIGVGFLVAVMAAEMLYSFTAAGPECPGKDPSWIGWCADAPDFGGAQ